VLRKEERPVSNRRKKGVKLRMVVAITRMFGKTTKGPSQRTRGQSKSDTAPVPIS